MVEKCLKHKPLYPYSELQYIIPPPFLMQFVSSEYLFCKIQL